MGLDGFRGCLAVAAILVVAPRAEPAPYAWPTPNRAFELRQDLEAFVQPTVSGLVHSGLFGCVRSEGRQFHEGLDLKPVARDGRGEASDAVFAILPGIVRYVNERAGSSSYGRYIAIEHTSTRPAIVSLYAHLLSVAPEIRPGTTVEAGATIGIMGRSAGGYSIPKQRAHLHLETGLVLTARFQTWFERQKYPSPNEHGLFNGMNIVGFDFLDFAERVRDGQVEDVRDYLRRLPVAAEILVRSRHTPDFVTRYPDLLRAPVPAAGVAGWRIEFTWFGLPIGWWPLTGLELEGSAPSRTSVALHDPVLLGRFPCQSLITSRGGHPVIGSKAADILEMLFVGE